MMSIYFLVSSVLSCFVLGKFIDKYGGRTPILILAGLFFLIGYLTTALLYEANGSSTEPTWVIIVIMQIAIGIGFAFYTSASCTLIPRLVKNNDLGIGFGMSISIEMIICYCITLISQYICDIKGNLEKSFSDIGFNNAYLCSILSALGFFVIVILEVFDQEQLSLVNKGENQNRLEEEEYHSIN